MDRDSGIFRPGNAAPQSHAQQWARDMFAETNHSFGTVARGAKTNFVFEFTNKYRETVHVSAVRAVAAAPRPR